MMRNGKILCMGLALGIAAAACRPAPQPAAAAQAVAVARVSALKGPQDLLLPAQARETAAPEPGGRKDYRIDVVLPAGVHPRLQDGVWVRLPIVRHARVKAAVQGLRDGRLELLLPDQVQELNGRGVQVELRIEAQGLHSLDFEALCSPRGLGAKVFAVREGLARSVDVTLLDLKDDGSAVVAGALRDDESVAVRGLENLLDGDRVRVLPLGEELP
jgi:hypothetical protein